MQKGDQVRVRVGSTEHQGEVVELRADGKATVRVRRTVNGQTTVRDIVRAVSFLTPVSGSGYAVSGKPPPEAP